MLLLRGELDFGDKPGSTLGSPELVRRARGPFPVLLRACGPFPVRRRRLDSLPELRQPSVPPASDKSLQAADKQPPAEQRNVDVELPDVERPVFYQAGRLSGQPARQRLDPVLGENDHQGRESVDTLVRFVADWIELAQSAGPVRELRPVVSHVVRDPLVEQELSQCGALLSEWLVPAGAWLGCA